MAGFVLRKNQRFRESVPVQYRGEGVAGEGTIKNLSLSGGHIAGSVPVVTGMVLELRIRLPEDEDTLVVDRAAVQWVKGLEFGVELTAQRKVADRIKQLISELVRKQHGPPGKG